MLNVDVDKRVEFLCAYLRSDSGAIMKQEMLSQLIKQRMENKAKQRLVTAGNPKAVDIFENSLCCLSKEHEAHVHLIYSKILVTLNSVKELTDECKVWEHICALLFLTLID